MSKSSQQSTCYSYVRFSHLSQAEGDSLRRQTEKAEAYCRRRGWVLDRSLTLRDLGVSAFRGDNAAVGNLRTFLEAVRRGTVPPGSVLLVESIDRLSRQGIDEGYDLCKRILKAGVHIVTFSPEREFGPEAVKSLTKGALELQLILERAAEESERKSERVGEAWAEKRRQARRGKVLTRRLPSWVEAGPDGRLRLIPAHAAAIQYAFGLAAKGYGVTRIVSRLTRENIPPITGAAEWSRTYVGLLLKDRRALGEFQPRLLDGTPDGEPIADYYPAAVGEELWLAARAGRGRRLPGQTGQGKYLSLFVGLLRNARDGGRYRERTRTDGGRRSRVLVNGGGLDGKASYYTFPAAMFEKVLWSCLEEIDPHEILNGDSAPDETLALRTELEGADAELAEAATFMEANGFSPTIGKRVQALEARKSLLAVRLAEARQRAVNPLSESWAEAKSLASCLEGEESRLRLRAALRRVIESVWLLIVTRGAARLCAVQIWFEGGKKRRDYLILYRPPSRARREPHMWVRSLSAIPDAGALDLRQPDHAKRLEAVLLAVPLDGKS